jgi:hypothetical protein
MSTTSRELLCSYPTWTMSPVAHAPTMWFMPLMACCHWGVAVIGRLADLHPRPVRYVPPDGVHDGLDRHPLLGRLPLLAA